MIALVPVRRGELATGGREAVAEAGDRVLLVGDGAAAAAAALGGELGLAPLDAAGDPGEGPGGDRLAFLELGSFRPGGWAAALAARLSAEDVVLLPASPDGRDLAPRLAAALGRPLVAGAIEVRPGSADVVRQGGRVIEELVLEGPFVATLLPGVRAVPPARDGGPPTASSVPSPDPSTGDRGGEPDEAVEAPPADGEEPPPPDGDLVRLVEADPASIDLGEASRIVAMGAGVTGPGAVALVAEVADLLGASVGATRVVTDAGLLPHERQIGTTGVSVDPRCYLAFGISGAAQHVGGVGDPSHVVSVNLDASCPMMAMADLAVVGDARAVLESLAARLRGGGAVLAAATPGDGAEGPVDA